MTSRSVIRIMTVLMVCASILAPSFSAISPGTVQAAIKPSYQITAYTIAMSQNLKDNTTDIVCEIEFKAFQDIKNVYLYMDPIFKVKSVKGLSDFIQEKDLLIIPVQGKKDKTFTISINYVARLNGTEYPGRAWNYVGQDGIYFFQWWYPVTLFTIAAGYSDVISMNITANLPIGWKAASSDIISEQISKDKAFNEIKIQSRDPSFFYHFIAGPYEMLKIEDPKKVISKTTFFGAKDKLDRGKEISSAIFDLLAYYESVFGTPAPKNYMVIQMPDKFKTVIAERASLFIPTAAFAKVEEKDKKDKKILDLADPEYLAERVASSWWGGTVFGVGPEAEFLNTSLSTYSGILYIGQKFGESKMIEMLRKARVEYFEKVQPKDEKPLSSITQEDKLDIYFRKKGPLVFHMLRQVIGEASFFKGLKNYAGKFAGKFATISDISQELSKASGMKLDWFFEQWVNQAGRLTYNIDFVLTPGRNPYKYKITLESKTPFKMPFKIDVIMTDRTVESFDWDLNDPDMEKILSSKKEPVGARIHNPEGYILTDESIVNTLTKGPISNFFYLGNFIIAEGTWQGNELMVKAADARAQFYKKMLKKYYNLDVPIVLDKDLNSEDLKKYNLILIGCTGCNSILYYFSDKIPVKLNQEGMHVHDTMIPNPEREGVYIVPNPSNPWSIVLADEFFYSTDNFDTHNLNVDYYLRNLKTGDSTKGYFHKFDKNLWEAPVTPGVKLDSPKNNQIEMFENTFTLKGNATTDFYITYNQGNPKVFGTPPNREFISAGPFEKKIDFLRGKEFVNDSLIIDSKTQFATYTRVLKLDFRGEIEPPKIKLPQVVRRFKLGQDVVIDWEATDNETFESDIQFAWSIDRSSPTQFAKGKRATLKGIKVGKHTFKLYGIDARGNINASVPPVSFEVVK